MNSKISTRKIVYGALIVAMGIILPQLFHIFGQTAGKVFLPMHIPVILGGLVLGPYFGFAAAILVPLLSSLITGMPPVPMLWFMLFELAAYAVIAGLLSNKLNVYLTLIITLIGGRAVYGLSLMGAVYIFGMRFPFANTAAFIGGIVSGLPGIVIQLVLIPPIMYALKKGGLLLESKPCRSR